MSVSFMWEVVRPERANSFANGTSRDIEALEATFGSVITFEEVPMLRAMHRATGLDESLWSDIAEVLERLQGKDLSKTARIKVWKEF